MSTGSERYNGNQENKWGKRLGSIFLVLIMCLPLDFFENNTDIGTGNNVLQSRPIITACGSEAAPTYVPKTNNDNDNVSEIVVRVDSTPAPAPKPGLATPSPTESEVINNAESSKVSSTSTRVNL